MFSLKFKTVAWKNNRLRYIFLLVATPLLLGLGIMGLAPVILLYVMMSMALAATRTTSQA
jgi:CDP-diacylglycerol--serine O-phosphatidyltransferase